VNIYTTQFACKCPTNGVRINYTWRIESKSAVPVESIVAIVEAVEAGDVSYHEEIADYLAAQFDGSHTLTAMHHGVLIETQRSSIAMEAAPGIVDAAPCEAAKPVVSSGPDEQETPKGTP
jgi:hypothetical protein